MSQPSTETNSTMPLPASLSVAGCLLNSQKLWCSGLLLSAFFSGTWAERLETSLVLCWRKQHNITDMCAPLSMSQHNTMGNSTQHWGRLYWLVKSYPSGLLCEKPWTKGYQQGLLGNIHDPSRQIWAPRSMSQPSTEAKQHLAVINLFVGRWLLAEQPETLMQWFAFVSLLQWNLSWTPWNFLGFMLKKATQHHRHLSTTFHVTTQHHGKQHMCVWEKNPEPKGTSRGPSLSSSLDGQWRGQWWGLKTYLRFSNVEYGQVAKP